MPVIFLSLFFVLQGLLGAYELPVSTSPHILKFSADESEYDGSAKTISLKGNVILDEVFEKKRVKRVRADDMKIHMERESAETDGKIMLEQDGLLLIGERGEIDYGRGSGILRNGRLKTGKFIFKGRTIKFSDKEYLYRRASLTTCDYNPPHYRILSSVIKFRPKSHFLAFNNLMMVGKIPVFYFPVLYRPMGKGTPFVSSFFPGYDNEKGFYLKSNYMYRWSPYSKSRIYLDYFSRKGIGFGGEYNYHMPDRNLSNISYYGIREHGTETERNGVNGGMWSLLGSRGGNYYYGQAFFRWLSDPGFNNDYFRDNPFAVSADKQAEAALTRRTKKTLLRASAVTKYSRNPATGDFEKDYEAAPKIEYSASSLKFGNIPFVHDFSADFASSKEENASYYQKKGGASWTMNTNVRLAGNVILQPSVRYSERIYLSTSPGISDSWIGRWRADSTLRFSRLWGNLDLRYSYWERLEKNKFAKDIHSSDGGEEKNALGLDLFVRPGYDMYVRIGAEYDMRNYRRGDFLDRVSNISAEYYTDFSSGGNLFLKDIYSPSAGNQSFILEYEKGPPENYFGFGIGNYKTSKDNFLISNKIGKKIGGGWRIEGVARYSLKRTSGLSFKTLSFYEKALSVYKEFHDFNTKLRFVSRKGNNEVSFFISLKWGERRKRDEADAYWNPWRKEDAMRD